MRLVSTITTIVMTTRIMVCKKKRRKKRGGVDEISKKLGKKKSGGGPPDLSGAGSRDGCPRLKVLQVPRKKMRVPPPLMFVE